jgi:hypothetical protein
VGGTFVKPSVLLPGPALEVMDDPVAAVLAGEDFDALDLGDAYFLSAPV